MERSLLARAGVRLLPERPACRMRAVKAFAAAEKHAAGGANAREATANDHRLSRSLHDVAEAT